MLEQPAEKRIIQMARKGDQNAITELYDQTKSYAYYIARQYLSSDADAQDILQEAYSAIFGKLDTYMDDKPFAPWLHKIVSNKCLDFIKRTRAQFVPIDDVAELAEGSEEVLPAEWLEKAEKRQTIMRMIDALPVSQRLSIIMYYMDGLAVPEIAEVLGVAEGSVKTHLYRGRQAIKAAVLAEETKGNKLYALAPMPLLTKAFELEAQAAVIPEAVSKAVWERTLNSLLENGVIASPGTNAAGIGANAPGAETSAASAWVNAADVEAANKGGLLNMFLSLSIGKKIGVIAAVLAVLMGLTLLGSTLAAPTPTPTPTPKSTPAAGTAGGSSGPGGSGAGNTDGPGGTGKPEATAPPKQDKPGNEDNTPIEIEVDPDLDADIKLKKEKMKELMYTWSIKVTGKDTQGLGNPPFLYNYYLTFEATKAPVSFGERNNMLGSYTGKGTLRQECDEPSYLAYVEDATSAKVEWNGKLDQIEFTLAKPGEDKPTPEESLAPLVTPEESLAPLVMPEESLAPLVPKDYKKTWAAEARSMMTWEGKITQNHFTGKYFNGPSPYYVDGPNSLNYEVYAWRDGKVTVQLDLDYVGFPPRFFGRISKKASWVDMK